jgi:hypothetical protein
METEKECCINLMIPVAIFFGYCLRALQDLRILVEKIGSL